MGIKAGTTLTRLPEAEFSDARYKTCSLWRRSGKWLIAPFPVLGCSGSL